MADRLSKINAIVEYSAIHKDRLSKIVAMVEYVAKAEVAGAVKIVPAVGTIKLYSSVGIQSTAGRLGL